jgi:hypothetical protein
MVYLTVKFMCVNNDTCCLCAAVSKFIVFVIVPDWLVDGLRNRIGGGMYFWSPAWNFVCHNEDSRN